MSSSSQPVPSSKTKLDQKLKSYNPLQPTDKSKEFLRDFFKVLSPDGKNNLAEDVSECADDETMRQLVQSIRTGLLIPIKARGGKTPTEITPSPRPGVDDSIENLKSLNIEPINRSPQSKIRDHCLERDGNKCVATGHYNYNSQHPRNALTTHLEAAHIIPFALGSFEATSGEAVDRHAKIWVNLTRYFPILRRMSFTSENLNQERNVMMMDPQLHTEFGQFRVVFEATRLPHQYRIKTFADTATVAIRDLPRNRLVRFKVHKGRWELPDPRLLEIHACIGNFLHMSGQAEIIDKVLKKFEDCGGLAPSGSTNVADLLAASSLSLLPSNFNETSDSQKSTEKHRPLEKQEPLQTRPTGTENRPWE